MPNSTVSLSLSEADGLLKNLQHTITVLTREHTLYGLRARLDGSVQLLRDKGARGLDDSELLAIQRGVSAD
jgi:hypothetical protein